MTAQKPFPALGPKEPGTRVSIGVSRSGKSHGITRDIHASVRAGVPVFVIDPMHEWERVPPDIQALTVRVTSAERGAAALSRGKRLALFTPEDGEDCVRHALDAACLWALSSSDLRGVACHEAWLAAPSAGGLSHNLSIINRAWAHKRVLAWFDAQRFALISRHVTELATELRLFACTGERDLAMIRDLGGGGTDLVDAVRLCARRLSERQPGWHVLLSQSRMPPFTPRRSPP